MTMSPQRLDNQIADDPIQQRVLDGRTLLLGLRCPARENEPTGETSRTKAKAHAPFHMMPVPTLRFCLSLSCCCLEFESCVD